MNPRTMKTVSNSRTPATGGGASWPRSSTRALSMSLGSALPWHALLTRCQKANVAVIVAPYMKAGVLEQVLTAVADSATITCVSRWTPEDIRFGVTDLACRELALTYGGAFLLHDQLHAKYYRFDNQILIGSSNLTEAGMNVPGTGNLEILCAAPPEFDPAQFESQLLQEAYPVSDADFALWKPDYPNPPPRPGKSTEPHPA